MPKEEKELTNGEIAEAVEKKHCPYCKSRQFIRDFPARQRFDFGRCDSEGKPFYNDPDISAPDERIECDNCGKDIPESIWREWDL